MLDAYKPFILSDPSSPRMQSPTNVKQIQFKLSSETLRWLHSWFTTYKSINFSKPPFGL
ncbi:MAG: hypothetical protein ACTS7I_02910 [Candidatus Hodgkinia cicadicola]